MGLDKELEGAVSDAVAPSTGKLIGCLIETGKNKYIGSNFEKVGHFPFVHAEQSAMLSVLNSELTPKIKSISMAGTGNITRFKQIVPCLNCYKQMLPYVVKEAILRLYFMEEDRLNSLTIQFRDLDAVYKKLKYSTLSSDNLVEAVKKLRSKTYLQGKIVGVIAELQLLGLNNNVGLYITGSAAKRGGASRLLHNSARKPYNDIDLIAVCDSATRAETLLEGVLKQQFGKK
jgi:cytidine deaminase